MRMLRDGRCGFVLVELIAVVLLLVVLGGVMVVSAQFSRRDARLSNCVSNLKQHAIGVENYAGSNSDKLPNGPLVPAGTGPAAQRVLGKPGAVSRLYAGPVGEISGDVTVDGWNWADPVINVLSPASEDTLNANTYANMQTHNAYWHIMGDYMVEGEGVESLQDIFVSPADEAGAVGMRAVRDARKRVGESPLPNDGVTGLALTQLPSYRYTVASMTRAEIYEWTKEGKPTGVPDEVYSDRDAVADNVLRVSKADVRYPAQKVSFYLWPACHDPHRELWFEDGAEISVAMHDGSARSLVASRDAIPYTEDPWKRFEGAGAYYRVSVERVGANKLVRDGEYSAFFWITNGGIKGRDLK